MAHIVEILTSVSPAHPMESRVSIRAIAGRGLEGDRYFAGAGTFSPRPPKPDHELTLVESEALAAFSAESSLPFTGRDARRNIVTAGVRLNDLVGVEFFLGPVRVRGLRLCEPCNYLARQTHAAILRGLVHRGGLRAQILADGLLRVGDPVNLSAS
ncbi:MAG TPA: MOSC domain-containing protein [Opitutus sp.]|nr:MOSC domain-containing protein [Opitutus sp.]